MHARVSTRQIQSGQMDDAVRNLRDLTVPNLREQRGFKGGLVLTDRNAGKLITISLWESEADLRAHDPPGYHGAVAAGAPIREVFEVGAQQSISEVGDAKYARTGTAQIQPGRMDEVISLLRETNYPAYAQVQGFKGAILVTAAVTNKGISITLWETDADIRPGDIHMEEQRARETQDNPSVVEYYAVSVQV